KTIFCCFKRCGNSGSESAVIKATGILGLVDAIEKYDESKGVKLSTYAEIRIRGQIIDELRKLDWVPRNIRKWSKEIELAILEVEQNKGREATAEEIAEYLGIPVDEYIRRAEKVMNSGLISIETNIGNEEDDTSKLWQILSINDDTPDKYVEEKELKEVLTKVISQNLDEREKLIITLYYYEELSMKEIGEVLNLTESRISQIHTKAMLKIRKELEKYVKYRPNEGQ
ncbi:MAG TPA: FliA/WhiG family RNA polymerase sigma factor, partial [Hydrogenothermaceae bacterium]|nr:FliA/WhiG family RNA polymerase sigma factor [Hydrogenothermaceae bacterium]